jgi:hypothetical protein
VRLQRVLDNLASSLHAAKVARKTSSHRRKWRASPELRLSRLYGYRLTPNGTAEIVPDEAEIIRLVIKMFAAGRSVAEVKAELDKRGRRNRSRKRFAAGEVMGLVRWIYSSQIKGPLGLNRRSEVYPAIVTPKMVKLAQKTLKREIDSASKPPSRRLEGGHDDGSVTEAVLGVGEALETRFSEDRY